MNKKNNEEFTEYFPKKYEMFAKITKFKISNQ